MTSMRKLIIGGVAALATAFAAQADIYVELDDGGETFGTAEVASGAGALDAIEGFLEGGGADMFAIYINDPANFSATTVGGAGFDTQLFLFNAAGMGVYANDDTLGVGLESTLPIGDANGPLAAGMYYLAISQYDYDPVSTTGQIFPDTPFTGVFGAWGPGGAGALLGWLGLFGEDNPSFSYSIALSGATLVTPVPAPGAAVLGALGLGAIQRLRRRVVA